MMVDSLPLTVLVPENAAATIEAYDQHAALKLDVVERSGAHLLTEEWDAAGVYVLLDRHVEDGSWRAYAGKAPGGVRARLRDHLRSKDHWYRAVLIRRDTTFGFNSAQIGWLEGRLYDLFDVAEDARLHNAHRPNDETLPPYDRTMLELALLPVKRVLRLIGHDPTTADDEPPPGRAPTSKRFYGVKLSDLVAAGLLAAGDRLVSTNGAWPATATISTAGTIVCNGKDHSSPSTAAAAAKGGAANGWEFWALESPAGQVPLSVLRAKLGSSGGAG